ncbi:hypothetical protein GOP47_0030194 [Adiantum capillus-veneris]|nr:hypothetical protein GOP47_0030194 [Adiantum capillus-veneris]
MLGWWVVHAFQWDLKYGAGRLPPGSMGFPLLGESLHMVSKPSTTLKPGLFFLRRQVRYGNLFKTHLFGEPVVVSTSASINTMVLQKEGLLFQSAFPAKFMSLIGKRSLMEAPGRLHTRIRGLVTRIVGPLSLPQCVHEIEDIVVKRLASWDHSSIIYMNKEACELTFDLAVRRILSLSDQDDELKDLLHGFRDFSDGLIAFPINLPGTRYNRCLKGRAKMVEIFEKLISKRARQANNGESPPSERIKDLLDLLLEEEERDNIAFTRQSTIDVMVHVIFAAAETTSGAFVVLVKLINDHPDVLQNLMEEHNAIRERKGSAKETLSWEEFKSMPYTRNVIYETLRLINVSPFVYREALVDVEIEGHVIPKGWKILLSFSSVHLDGDNFSDPLSFNPSRWKEMPASGNGSCFMGYGGGPRTCPGSELSILELSIFVHHFVTKFSWTTMGEEEIIRSPGVKFKNGHPIYVNKKNCMT